MNRENIKKVRDVIAGQSSMKFDMANWITDRRRTPDEVLHDCGTAACIAGWAFAVQNAGNPLTIEEITNDDDICIEEFAGEFLGLSYSVADRLFCPVQYRMDLLTQAHAVRVLDHLLDTGEVDWKSTRRAKKSAPVTAQDTTEQSAKPREDQ